MGQWAAASWWLLGKGNSSRAGTRTNMVSILTKMKRLEDDLARGKREDGRKEGKERSRG
jgi:hypothetical protein